ncbi:hypothetical protein BKA70DRAFT_504680 [Coprinopsis sp. MPI-PUGE-AT-0042]|nr:hypothetical protein BKA70DRAFT_504680 [Coprinopsis sp. MPI-PUGE-AT-0042]
MNHCLQTTDILLTIFESFLDVPSEEGELPPAFASLASLARTCRTFQVPAIATLWRKIPGLYVVASLFPQESLKIDREKRYSAVSSVDFEAFSARLSVYRPYVKSIGYPKAKGDGWTPKSLHANFLFMLLENTSVPIPLFPNAHDVTIPCLNKLPMVSLFYPPLVLGPSTSSIVLDTDDMMVEKVDSPGDWYPKGDARQWDVIASALLKTAPKLHDFSIQVPQLDELVKSKPLERPQIDRIIQQTSLALTEIYISTVLVSPATIVALGSLPTLSSLEIALGERNDCLIEAQHPLTLQFASLNTLLVVFVEELNRSDFLSSIDAPLLQKCTLIFSMLIDKNEDFFLDDILASFFRRNRQSLMHFAVDSETSNTIDWALVLLRITTRTLQLFAKCQSLTSLTFDLATLQAGEIRDDDLACAFSCWPKMETFSLRRGRYDLEDVIFSAQGVFEATKFCPHLSSLNLPCDFRGILEMTQDFEPNHVLTTWNVGYSPIECAGDVGLWLKSHFPGLKVFDFSRFPRAYLFESASKGRDIWPTHKELLIELTQWMQVARVLGPGVEGNMEVDE